MALFVNSTQSSYGASKHIILKASNQHLQTNFIKAAVNNSKYNVYFPRACDSEGIKASPLAKNLDILA